MRAVRPDREALEIRFPRVAGYRVELPEERLDAKFTPDSVLELTPDLVGPSITKNEGIIGEGVELTQKHLDDMRQSTVLFHLTKHLIYTKWRDAGEAPKLHLFGQLKRITKQWLDTCLQCKGETKPAQLLYKELADMACNRITDAINQTMIGNNRIKAVLDPYNPIGSTAYVKFNTSRKDRWRTEKQNDHSRRRFVTSGKTCRMRYWPSSLKTERIKSITTSTACPRETCESLLCRHLLLGGFNEPG